ncbi:MAG: methylamine utilization protein [Nitrospirae bacterium]|nr:methylamine utilization protein [Nitrospirota bacterium]
MRELIILRGVLLIGIMAGFLVFPFNVMSATLDGVVKGRDGKPVKDAVIYAVAADGSTHGRTKQQEAVMDQVNKEFVPYVLPVQVGTAVRFPNKDNIRHHVYSISPAKRFELPLYKGTPSSPVVFDKPGAVVLGCNIHDWMAAYIYVVETPYFATTGKDGSAAIHDLPQGEYEVLVWHPLQKERSETTGKRVNLSEKGSRVDFVIELKPDWRPRRTPSTGGGGGGYY